MDWDLPEKESAVPDIPFHPLKKYIDLKIALIRGFTVATFLNNI